VYTAARERIRQVLREFSRVYVSGPSGKDSSVMLHIAAREARAMGRRIGVLYCDLEAQYRLTIDHVAEMFDLYSDVIDPYWVALPLQLRNATSMGQPYWMCWDPAQRPEWVRQPPEDAITDTGTFPFFRAGMEFEEFVERFGHWYANGQPTACLVGIRTDESLNRWRTLVSTQKERYQDLPWTTYKGNTLVNAYPIYDWTVDDIWTYVGREQVCYNKIYDRMYQAGLSLPQMRICQPYGDDQRRGLWLYHVLEPETWTRVVARVTSARMGSLYANKSGNILGYRQISKPPDHTWESYTRFLLNTLPPREQEHYRMKFAVFLKWWSDRGYPDGIPDEAAPSEEARKRAPSWRRLAKVVLKNDRLCRSIGFDQHASSAYAKYQQRIRERMQQWMPK